MSISYVEAYTGCDTKVKIYRVEQCEACAGTGSRSKTLKVCPACRGQGQTFQNMGFIKMATTCGQCHGTGEIAADPCPECRGQGRLKKPRELNVPVPAGVSTGSWLRLRGEGEPGSMGGQPGDLFVEIAVRHHDLFSREGKHVLYDSRITMTLAALGGELDVPSVTGETKTIYVPAGAQHGKLIRIPGLGFPVPGSSVRGDQIVAISVATPKNLTERQIELLEEFAAIEHEKLNEGPIKGMARKIGEKVKKVFHS